MCYESVIAAPGDDPKAAATAQPGYSGTQDNQFYLLMFCEKDISMQMIIKLN